MNRRGNILDTSFILGMIFIIMVFALIGVYIANLVNTMVQDANIPSSAKVMNQNLENDIPDAVDFIILMVMVGLPLASLVLAFFNNIHPLFFYISLAFMIIILLVGYAYGTLWAKVTNTTLLSTAESMPMTNFIMNHYGIYTMVCLMLIAIGTYVKTQAQGGYY